MGVDQNSRRGGEHTGAVGKPLSSVPSQRGHVTKEYGWSKEDVRVKGRWWFVHQDDSFVSVSGEQWWRGHGRTRFDLVDSPPLSKDKGGGGDDTR